MCPPFHAVAASAALSTAHPSAGTLSECADILRRCADDLHAACPCRMQLCMAAKLCVLVLVALAAVAPLLGVATGSCRQPFLARAIRAPSLTRPDEHPAPAPAVSHAVVVHHPPGSAAPEEATPDVARAVLAQEKLGRGRKVIAMSLFGNSRCVHAHGCAVRGISDWPGPCPAQSPLPPSRPRPLPCVCAPAAAGTTREP